MNITPIQTDLFNEGENLERFIGKYIPMLADGSLLAVTSKIVALAERRTSSATAPTEKDRLIRVESQWSIPTKYIPISIKDGMIMAAAGIDESNADGKLVLLPKDSFAAAARLRSTLVKRYKLKHFGVLITDSRTLPLRKGVVGVAVGYAGFRGLKTYQGKSDLFGRPLRVTSVDIADSLATAATLVMGEGAERQPLAVINNVPVQWSARPNRKELVVAPADDLYEPLFRPFLKNKSAKRNP